MTIADSAGALYAISADDSYATHIYLLDLKSSTHYQQARRLERTVVTRSHSHRVQRSRVVQGFDYAVLAGKLAVDAQVTNETGKRL